MTEWMDGWTFAKCKNVSAETQECVNSQREAALIGLAGLHEHSLSIITFGHGTGQLGRCTKAAHLL